MSKLLFHIFFFLFLIFKGPVISNELSNALKTGNSNRVAAFFENSVDLSIPNNEGVYSKMQAQLILKTFFLKNKPSDFTVVHNGNSKNNSFYSIGNLKTNTGTFRVYILYKETDGKTIVLELKIESDE